jgi:energy-converting hydrogenase Eha subunit G
MRKVGIFLALGAVAAIGALFYMRSAGVEPVITGNWRELRPPDFE